MDIFTLRAVLGLDTTEYDDKLSGSEEKAIGWGGKVSGALGTAVKVGAGAMAAVAAAGTAAGAVMVKNAGEVASYGDNIDKMSQKMGISAQAYQEWDAIMQHSGTSIEALKPSMKMLASAAEKGDDAFQKLGISEQEVASLSQEDLFSRVITGLQGMEEGTERTYLTSQLLGRGAVELGALLNTSAEDTEKMRQRVHELGGVMSDEAVKAAAAYQDSLQDLTTSIDGIKRGVVSDFLPSITSVMDGLTMIFSGEEGGTAAVSQGINEMMTNITEAIPRVFEVGGQIIGGLADAVIDNLPTLMSAGVEIIINLATGIIGAIPKLIEKAPEIVTAFAGAIIDNVPKLLASAAEIVQTIIDGIIEHLPDVLSTGSDTVGELISGIMDKIPDLLDSANELLTEFLSKISEKLPEILSSGGEMIVNLVTGILEKLPDVIESAGEIFNTFLNFIIDNFPEILNAGIDLIVNLVKGIIDSLPKIFDAAVEVITKLLTTITEKFPDILAKGKEILDKIVEGIKEVFSHIVDAGKETVDKVKEGIMAKIEDAKEWGKHLISNFVDGLKEKWEFLKDKVSGVGDAIAGVFEHSKPRRESPFYGEEKWFPHMFENLAESVRNSKHILTDELGLAFDDMEPDLGFGADSVTDSIGRSGGVRVVQNIYSKAQTASELMREARYEQERAVLMGV